VSRAVIFYRTAKGDCPIEEFLDTLPPKAAQKIIWTIKLIRELDAIPGQYFKKLHGTDDLWEGRIVHGGNSYRLFGFFGKGGSVIFTHGIMKKTQKTPHEEIQRAEKLKADYTRRS
jgi:phage-related protein